MKPPSSEAEKDPAPDIDQSNASTQSLLSQGGSGYESQYGSLFGSRFSLADGSGVYVSSLCLAISVSVIVVVAIILVAVIITLAVMLSACEQQSTLSSTKYDVTDFCSSLRLNAELNNAQEWVVPEQCKSNMVNYVNSGQYMNDIQVAVDSAQAYLKPFIMDKNETYGVILDIDETALSSTFYYVKHNGWCKGYDDLLHDIWMKKRKAVPLRPVLDLYNELDSRNLNIFFISERPASVLNFTMENLVEAGYKHWHSLILRSGNDAGLTVQAYKAKKRLELEQQGYKIISALGDQWSDIVGPATGSRAFKLPNPMYQIL